MIVSFFAHVGDNIAKPSIFSTFFDLTRIFEAPDYRQDKLAGMLFAPTEFTACPDEGCLGDNPKTHCAGGELHRLNENAVQVNLGVLDFDDLPPVAIEEIRRALDPYEHIWHTTWSHPKAKKRGLGRYRALIAFSRPVPAEEWHDFWPRMAARFGSIRDQSCRDPARFYFTPAFPADAAEEDVFEYLYHPGLPLPVDAVLADPLPDFARPPPTPPKKLELTTYVPSEWAVEWANGRLDHYAAKIAAIDDAKGPMHPDLNEASFMLGGLTPHLLDPEHVALKLLDSALLLNEGREDKYIPIIAKGISDGQAKPFAPEPRYAWTDTGNAERVVSLFRGSIHYVSTWGKWLIWDGASWRVEDTIQPQVKEACAELHNEVSQIQNPQARKDGKKFALQSENLQRRRAAETLASTEEGIRVAHDQLDADPWLFGVENGTLDLRTGELRAAAPEDWITKRSPVVYDPQATAPRWEQFLGEVFNHNVELLQYIQRAVGYSMTGLVSEQKLFFLHGTGANGKSTFMGTLLNLFGSYGTPGAPSLLIQDRMSRHPTEVADLYGLRMVSCQEVEEGRYWDEVLLKQLTGGDPIKARRMREDFWTFDPSHKFWVSGNHTPSVRGTDDGIWRRIALIPFTQSFLGRADPALPLKLLKELPGILRWAVEGALLWQERGLREPPIITKATLKYREEQDVIGSFLSDRCEVGPGFVCSRAQIRRAYEMWSEEAGDRPWTPRAFNNALRARGLYEIRMDGSRERGWEGVRLRSTMAAVPMERKNATGA